MKDFYFYNSLLTLSGEAHLHNILSDGNNHLAVFFQLEMRGHVGCDDITSAYETIYCTFEKALVAAYLGRAWYVATGLH